ncbi:MAG: Flp pilus assembly complex ATPase component TadA [Gammaproteobacteria bacterium]|nr:Flp pilus assembly complex ATPase component TadA [Gammaproteobacteria bacterium]
MSSPSHVIDLPVSPLRSTVAEGNLLNAPVAATLMNGKTITGRLVTLDGPQAVLTLQGSEKGRSIIKFSDLRQLNFINKHPTNTAKHPLMEEHAGDVSMPRAVEDFHVTFVDGRFLTGRTRGSFVDEIGLHLFQLVGSAYISRIFIPAQVVKKYNIGESKPATVHAHGGARARKSEPAADKKPALKRRKTDSKTSGLALNSIQLEQALDKQAGQSGGNLLGSKQIGAMLVEAGIITAEQLEAALKTQQQDRSQKLGEILVRMGTVSAHDIYRTLAHKFSLPFVLLRNFYIDFECLSLVPADVAQKYMLVPLVIHQNRLVVAMDDPANTEALTLLRFITRFTIEPTIATREDINWALGKYYGAVTAPAAPAPAVTAAEPPPPRPEKIAEHGAADSVKPIISFVDNTLLDAIQRNAVDIHFAPKRDYVELLFRIDGALIPIRRFSKVLYPKVVDRLKTMGGMDLHKTRGAQHGRASIVNEDLIYELRIALMDGADGAEAVIHLLNTSTRLRTLNNLGLNTRDEFVFMEELNKTYSMVLVTGPEGSDKSATLYAAMLALKTQNLRILTLEDPISHHLTGIDQVQLERGAGASYAALVKHMDLRNTDVVMFGELRDGETAVCAIDTALGKHLVLGKLHADNTVEAVLKLTRMGIQPRRLKASLPCVLAQRALRLNCCHCLEVEDAPADMRQALGVGMDEVFYRSRGCPRCNQTGYQGRTMVYEMLEMTPEIYALLESGAAAADIRQQAIRNGMVTLMESALSQARMRTVSLAEAYRNG